MNFTKRIYEIVSNGGHAGHMDKLVNEIKQHALKEAHLKRDERKCNIAEDTDLLTEQFDKNGMRRFSMKCIGDEPVMMPCVDGYWTPAKDKIKQLQSKQEVCGHKKDCAIHLYSEYRESHCTCGKPIKEDV